MALVAALVVAYLLGTLPTAAAVTRLATRGAVDIHTAGTGNPGAANALGVLGSRWAALILLIDIAKAAAACLIAWAWVDGAGAHLAGSAAVIGHCYPVWSRFRSGGKGVACAVGQALVTFPVYFPISLAVAVLSTRARLRQRAHGATVVACACWVVGATAWAARDWPNGWGPDPDTALVVAAVVSSAVIVRRFLVEARRAAATASS